MPSQAPRNGGHISNQAPRNVVAQPGTRNGLTQPGTPSREVRSRGGAQRGNCELTSRRRDHSGAAAIEQGVPTGRLKPSHGKPWAPSSATGRPRGTRVPACGVPRCGSVGCPAPAVAGFQASPGRVRRPCCGSAGVGPPSDQLLPTPPLRSSAGPTDHSARGAWLGQRPRCAVPGCSVPTLRGAWLLMCPCCAVPGWACAPLRSAWLGMCPCCGCPAGSPAPLRGAWLRMCPDARRPSP